MDESIIGKEVDGYRIQEIVGRGGMGVVYKAEDIALSRTVALKRIDPVVARDEAFLRRFRSEARALARIDSPNIVGVHALRQTEIGLLIVMEYVAGGTLKHLLQDGPLDWQSALPLIKQMLRALEHAHKAGVIHRDIKPHNIMLSQDGTVKVTDFGLAKVHQSDDPQRTITQGVYGTLNYMSPEQVEGGSDIDRRSDLYSLGMTAYELLTGTLPFPDDSSEFTKMRTIVEDDLPRPEEFHAAIPRGLTDVVMRALEKKPDHRFQSAATMREALEAFEAQYTGEIHAPSPAEVQSGGSPGGKWMQFAGGLVVIILLMVGGYLLLNTTPFIPDEPGGQGSAVGQPGEETTMRPSVEQRQITLTSEPSGAEVFINERKSGLTPLRTTLSRDTVRLRLRKEGFRTLDTLTFLSSSGRDSLSFQLQRRTNLLTTLSITTRPEDARVFINDTLIGRSPIRHKVDRNTVHLRVQKEGYATKDTLLHPKDAQWKQVELGLAMLTRNLEQRPSTLVLRTSPSGSVAVGDDRESSGQSFEVAAGTHRLRFAHPEYGTKDTTVTVAQGDSLLLTCYFTHQVVVQSEPWANVYVNGKNTQESTTHIMTLGADSTYDIGVQIRRSSHEIEGGTYFRQIGDRRVGPTPFTGSSRTLRIRPSFEEQRHVLRFQAFERDP